MEACKELWRKLPYAYLRCLSFSDLWSSYNFLPARTHQMVGKETRETAPIERLNNTLRQRISRLVRKTLSFSKTESMLNLHFKFFAYHYNLQCVSTNK
jgi:insertion element IS1 protein InsB